MLGYSIVNVSTLSVNELNEKEKYYIEIYQAYEFGYNSNKGNSKKG